MLSFLLPTGRGAAKRLSSSVPNSARCFSVQSSARRPQAAVLEVSEMPVDASSTALPVGLFNSLSHSKLLHSTFIADSTITSDSQAGPSQTPRSQKRRAKSGKVKPSNTKPLAEIRPPSLPRTELYLESIIAQGVEPTLADLEQLRPPEPTERDLRSPMYKTIYEEAIEAIDRPFTKQQLRTLAQQILSKEISRRATKRFIMDLILTKAWGLPSPAQVEKERRERTEIKRQGGWRILSAVGNLLTVHPSITVFPVSPAELFVLLGQGQTCLVISGTPRD